MAAKAEQRYRLALTNAGLNPGAPAVLLQRDQGPWALPALTFDELVDFQAVIPVLCTAVAERFGLDVSVLLYLRYERQPETKALDAVVALDVLGPLGVTPAGLEWVPAGALADAPLAQPDHGALVSQWAGQLAAGTQPALRVPWANPGWRPRAQRWIESETRAAGLALTGPLEPMRTWSLSCLLRVPTDGGLLYFKALPEMFAREPRLTQTLAELFPGRIPAVLAFDENEHWLITRDFSGRSLRERPEPELWSAALAGYARLQIETAACLDLWPRLGCPDRRLPVLASQVDDLFADRDSLLPDQPGGLTTEQIIALLALAGPLKAACARLEACGLPYVLEHGDLHAHNIAVNDSGFVYYDWTDGCLAHPFTCLSTFLEVADPSQHDALCQAYLAEWAGFAAPDQLAEALRLARPLSALHIAISYRDIRLNTEPLRYWELDGAQAFFLKEVLKYKDALLVP